MDCEKFDRIVLDLMYGELDELTETAWSLGSSKQNGA